MDSLMEKRIEHIESFKQWVDSLRFLTLEERLEEILRRYKRGCDIQSIRTLMRLSRSRCETMLQSLEKAGVVHMIFQVATEREAKKRRKQGQEVRVCPTPKKLWAWKAP